MLRLAKVDESKSDEHGIRCSICWEDCGHWEIGGWIYHDYGESEWVCSQRCSDIVGENFVEYFHSFYSEMIGWGSFYGQYRDLMPYEYYVALHHHKSFLVRRQLRILLDLQCKGVKWI